MRYAADPMAMFKVMNKVKPFDSTEQMRLNLPVRVAYESLRSGKGEEGDFHTLAAAVNVAMVCAEKIDPLVEETAILARDALVRCWHRYQKTGRWGFDGPALVDIPAAIDLHEQLVANQTPLQMQKAMVEVIRRMDAGEVQT
jgi:hypothetical protein